MLTKMQKWGNSYAVRLPKAVVQETGIREGEALEVEVTNRQIRLRRSTRREYSLGQLVAGIRRSNLHAEIDFGAPEGCEAF
ncbi:MAG: AbrB/MazE/SpoVT family DNA-binding domain-containing protein [Burkholderiales bacterium]|nr:AbrB/MazE/SpoVT family DNA-binding domain-containing protein [Burkholderiales bacterium]